jgi:hypothetical protein
MGMSAGPILDRPLPSSVVPGVMANRSRGPMVSRRDPRLRAKLRVNFVAAHEQEQDPLAGKRQTYLKSHSFPATRSFAEPCGVCDNRAATLRCDKCRRCDVCSRLIFCKGAPAERTAPSYGPDGTETPDQANRLVQRMDKVIWDAFRTGAKDAFDVLLGLVEVGGVDVNFKRPSKKETALMAAAYRGNLEAARRLLELGADTATKTDDGLTAWAFASKHGHVEVADLISKYASGELTPLIPHGHKRPFQYATAGGSEGPPTKRARR